jgi:hypothetical protein
MTAIALLAAMMIALLIGMTVGIHTARDELAAYSLRKFARSSILADVHMIRKPLGGPDHGQVSACARDTRRVARRRSGAVDERLRLG